MSSTRDSCSVCDRRIDAYGVGGTRCSRCNQGCPRCGGDTAYCRHPLPEPLVEVEALAPVNGRHRIAA